MYAMSGVLPLIASAYIAFVCGLLAGFAAWAWIAVFAATIAGVGAVVRRDTRVFSLALVFAAGAVIAVRSPAPQRPLSARDTSHAGVFEKLRARAGKAIDRDFGGDAPMARALLIADQGQLDRDIRDKYAAAGIVHMLSISGLHIAVIAAAMQLIFQVVGASQRGSLVGSAFLTAIYVLVIGAPPPAVRSALMLGASAASKLLQRPASPWAALAVGAFVPLINPRTVLDVGYQLSVLGMCALFAAGKIKRRFISRKLSGLKRQIAADLTTSLVACAVTAPVVAWTFGRLSLIAPAANLLAGPVIAVTQPMLFLALVLAPVPPLSKFVASAAHPPL